MDAIQTTITRIMALAKEIGQASCTVKREPDSCAECEGLGLIITRHDNGCETARVCKCQEVIKYQRMLKLSGLSEALRDLIFESYIPYEQQTKAAKSMAEEYCESFLSMENTRKNSICFLGQVGSGKTHLSVSILNALFDHGVGVLYMPFRSAVTELKQNIMDDEVYPRLMDRYKKARVLLIDDFAKGSKSQADINYMFDIINHRYLTNKPIILSSELTLDKMIQYDEAVGSRVMEMCKGRIAYFHGEDKNYRLRSRLL